VGTPYRAFVPTPDQISEARGRIAAAGLTPTKAGESLLSYYPTSPTGELALSTTVPSGLAGITLDLVGLGIVASGKPRFSNEVELVFN
jgi:hypothetical protein